MQGALTSRDAVDTIPTDGSKEDMVPMAMAAAWKLRRVVRNVRYMLAIEFMCAAQGIDYRAPLETRTRCGAHAAVRRLVAPLERDRVLSGEIERLAAAIHHDELSFTPMGIIMQDFDNDRRSADEHARSAPGFGAPRGSTLSCGGWQQEAALRMLMNNLDPEVAELSGSSRRLRRNGESRAQLGSIRRDRCGAACSSRMMDIALSRAESLSACSARIRQRPGS